MTRTLVALGGAALALLLVSGTSVPADARSGHGGHGHGGHHARSHGGHHFHHGHHFRRHVHHRRFIGVGVYAYGDGCYWLRRNALETGSRYWWRRYEACIDGYGYY